MSDPLTYVESRDRKSILLTREFLRELPDNCADFVRALEPTTTPLTRVGYLRDLKLFFKYLTTEVPEFADLTVTSIRDEDLDRVTGRHIALYNDYLTLYIRDDEREETNEDASKMRKLSALRSYFKFLFKNNRVSSNVAQLIDLPKLHEKPILRLEIDEIVRMLNQVESGSALTDGQKKYHELTKKRDLAMISLFLGTGIRVSECVGIDIDDIDFSQNGFFVTRKGGAQVILYFPDEVAAVLKDYVDERKTIDAAPGHENALFLSMQKKRINVRSVENLVKKYALLAAPLKKRFSPHKLRSTFGTNLYHETGDIYLVADVLGHSDVNTTRKHYAAMSDDRRRLAAAHVKLRDDEATLTGLAAVQPESNGSKASDQTSQPPESTEQTE